MNKRLSFAYGGLIALAVGLSIGFNELRYDSNKDGHKLYQKVFEKADQNADSNVTESEWLDVYKSLGKPYDARKPSSLTVDEMRSYLGIKE
jgi:hypothetical protein